MKVINGRFGHGKVPSMKRAASSEAALGVEAVHYQKFQSESCAMQKNTRHRSLKSVIQSTELLLVVRSDACGPMDTVLRSQLSN